MFSDPLTSDIKEHHGQIIPDMTLSIEISEWEKENLAEKMHRIFEIMSSLSTNLNAFIIFLFDEDRFISVKLSTTFYRQLLSFKIKQCIINYKVCVNL